MAFDGDMLYAGTDSGRVFRTSPGAPDWTPIGGGLPRRPVHALGAAGPVLLAGLDSGLYRSESGATWSRSDNGLEGKGVFALVVRGEWIFAAGDAGVHRSGDGGRTWTPVNDGMAGLAVSSLAMHQGFLHAGTFSSGVWRRPLQELSAAAGPERPLLREAAAGRILLQPGGWAGFHLRRAGPVGLSLFEPTGRRTADLFRDFLPAGRHRVRLPRVLDGPVILRLDSPDGVSSLLIHPVE
jgi:hypothetical protein